MTDQTLLRSLLLYFPVKLVPAATGFFFIIYLYGHLPKGHYVDYSVAASTALIVAQIGGGWVGNALLYYLPTKDNKSLFISNCFVVILVSAFISSFVGAIISAIFFPNIELSLLIFGLCLTQVLYYFCTTVLQCIYDARHQFVAVIVQAILQISIVYFLFHFFENDFKFAIVSLLSGFSGGLICMLLAIHNRFKLDWRILNLQQIKEDVIDLLRYGAPMTLWMFATLVISTSDRFVISLFSLTGGDGFLSIKDLLLGASGLISMPLLMLMHPLIFVKYREGAFPGHLVEKAIAALIILFSLFWTAWQFVGITIFEMLSKKTLSTSINIIFILFVANAIGCIAIYLQKRLEVHHKTLQLSFIAMFVALFSICLSIVFGKYYGLYGVALSYLIAQTSYSIIVWKSIRRHLRINISFIYPIIKGVVCWLFGGVLWMGLQYMDSISQNGYVLVSWILVFFAFSALVVKTVIVNLLKSG